MMKRLSFSIALSLSLAACGGPSTSAPGAAAPAPIASDSESAPAAPEIAVSAPLPEVPATPADVPISLTAAITAGNPNAQITQIGTFVDAVMPGMAAFVTPQALMQQVGGIIQVSGLRGIDLNQPLRVLVLDSQQAMVVATVSSEAELNDSIEGSPSALMLHDGFAAIGPYEALSEAGAYALSNAVRTQAPENPTVSLYLKNIMSGPHADEVRRQIKDGAAGQGQAAVFGSEITLSIMSNIEILRLSLAANASTATVVLTGEGISGSVKEFLGKQRPSSFAMVDRIGTGPWALAAGGRLDLSPFIPLLVKLGEAQADPIVTQIAAQLGGLNGEMATALNLVPNRELLMAMELGNAKSLGLLLESLLKMVGGQKDLDFGGMKGQLKLGSIKTRGGSLHELKLTPTTAALKESYGKNGVSGFMGIVADSLIVTFGPSAKKQAKTLAGKNASLPGKGTEFAKAIESAKGLQESFIVAFDLLSLNAKRPAKNIAPVVLGLGFTPDTFSGRLVIPAEVVKEAASGAF